MTDTDPVAAYLAGVRERAARPHRRFSQVDASADDVGQRCVRKSGKPYAYSHALRWEAATRGHLPLNQGSTR